MGPQGTGEGANAGSVITNMGAITQGSHGNEREEQTQNTQEWD